MSGPPDTTRGPFIATNSGSWWYLATPSPADVRIEDVAHALAYTNRYTGHAGLYSVATHSMHVADIVRWLGHPEHELAALVHDAHEAYVGDVSAPLKRLLPDFSALERVNEAAVREAFGVPVETPAVVKRADLMALADEALVFFASHEHWTLPYPPSGLPIRIEPAVEAAERWIGRLAELRRVLARGAEQHA